MIRRLILPMNWCLALVFILSACTLPKRTVSVGIETPSAYPSPVSSQGVDSAPLSPTAQATAEASQELLYPPPAAVVPGQGSQSASAYPPPLLTTQQSNAYPLPGEGFEAASLPTVQNTPAQVGSTPIPYPFQETPAQSFPTTSAATPPAQPRLSQTIVPTTTVTATPGIVRTNIVATDPDTVTLVSGRTQLVEFFAYWCILCKSMAPVVNGLEDKYANRVNFIFLDVDDPRTASLKEALGYTLIAKPHFYLLDGQGKSIREWIGFVLVDELEAAIRSSSR